MIKSKETLHHTLVIREGCAGEMIEKVTENIKSINDLILLKALGKAHDNHISFFYVLFAITVAFDASNAWLSSEPFDIMMAHRSNYKEVMRSQFNINKTLIASVGIG